MVSSLVAGNIKQEGEIIENEKSIADNYHKIKER